MLSFIKKTVAGRSPSPDIDRDNLVRDEYIKKQLKEELAVAIKNLQRNHINTDREIERNDEDALRICSVLEGIFLHGFQDKKTGLKGILQNTSIEEIQSISFWDLLEQITHNDVILQINNLAVTSRIGMCRAWVRLALNDCLIESYMDAVQRNRPNLKSFFNPNAFLMDSEALPIAIDLLQGLIEFQFHLNYNSSKLDSWSMETLTLAGIIPEKRRKTLETGSPAGYHRSFEGSRCSEAFFPSSQTPSDRSRTSSQFDISDSSKLTSSESSALQSSQLTITTESKSTDDQMQFLSSSSSNDHSVTHVQTVGNRLSLTEDNWAGWSSAFEAAPVRTSETKTTENEGKVKNGTSSDISEQEVQTENVEAVEQPSFQSLLQTYGASRPMQSQMAQQLEINTSDRVFTPQQTQAKLPLSPSEDENIQQMNFEVVPLSSSFNARYTDERTQFLLDHITVIGLERGLDKQSFQCIGCGRPIGLIYGPYKVCYYDGGYYCVECHEDEEHTIPAKIIHNWDFRPYKVAKLTKVFLMKIEEEPLFHIDEINPTLYNAVPELNEVKMLRIQLQYLKGYILTCKNDIAEDFRRRLWPREYLCDDVHQYSPLDLVQVHTGQLVNHLRKVIGQFSKHVFKCSLCSQKGFICEICNSQKIIYPFEIVTTIQCHRCLSLYHKKCKKDRRCAKCLRLQFRKRREQQATEWLESFISTNSNSNQQ